MQLDTELLAAFVKGDPTATTQVEGLVYDQLRDLAGAVRGSGRKALSTTALTHEAYLRLASGNPITIESRRHFFTLVARVMRNVLVDQARSRRAAKRGGEDAHVPFDTSVEGVELLGAAGSPWSHLDWIDLDDALSILAEQDPRMARLVELRFFGGMTMQEVAEALEISDRTAARDWRLARAWLHDRLADPGDGDPELR